MNLEARIHPSWSEQLVKPLEASLLLSPWRFPEPGCASPSQCPLSSACSTILARTSRSFQSLHVFIGCRGRWGAENNCSASSLHTGFCSIRGRAKRGERSFCLNPRGFLAPLWHDLGTGSKHLELSSASLNPKEWAFSSSFCSFFLSLFLDLHLSCILGSGPAP